MLDKRSSALLFKINTICSAGSYQIVEEGELLSCFPAKFGMGAEGLQRILSYLEERGFIEIKYADGGVYCISPLPDGRLYFENVLSERSEGARKKRNLFVLTVIGAFLGSFMGAAIACLLFSL